MNGETALVVGASRGFGRGVVESLVARKSAFRCHSERSEPGAPFAPRLLFRGERSRGIPPSLALSNLQAIQP